MGDLAGVPKAECRKRIEYYLKKTSLIEHRKKKNETIIRRYEKAGWIGAGTFE